MKLSVRQIYFYLVSFITLLIILFAGAAVVSTVLTDYVFKTRPAFTYQPPVPYFQNPFYMPRVEMMPPMYEGVDEDAAAAEDVFMDLKNQDGAILKSGQRQAIDTWIIDYKRWKRDQENQKKADLTGLIANIVALLIFSPVFAYHFLEARKNK